VVHISIAFLVHIQKGTSNDKPQLCLHRQSYFLHDRTKWYINSRTFWYVYKKEYCQHILTMLLLSKVKMVHWWSTFWYIYKKDQIVNEKNVVFVVVVVVVVVVEFFFICLFVVFVCVLSCWNGDKSFSKQKQAIELWYYINRAQKPASILKLVYLTVFHRDDIFFTLTFKQYCLTVLQILAAFELFRKMLSVRWDNQNRHNNNDKKKKK